MGDVTWIVSWPEAGRRIFQHALATLFNLHFDLGYGHKVLSRSEVLSIIPSTDEGGLALYRFDSRPDVPRLACSLYFGREPKGIWLVRNAFRQLHEKHKRESASGMIMQFQDFIRNRRFGAEGLCKYLNATAERAVNIDAYIVSFEACCGDTVNTLLKVAHHVGVVVSPSVAEVVAEGVNELVEEANVLLDVGYNSADEACVQSILNAQLRGLAKEAMKTNEGFIQACMKEDEAEDEAEDENEDVEDEKSYDFEEEGEK